MSSPTPEITPGELAGRPDRLVVDVREDDEWHAGHLADARHIRLSELPARLGEIPRDQSILVVCRSGGRSRQATDFLNGNGFQATNLAGGLSGWARSGYDLVSDSGGPGAVI